MLTQLLWFVHAKQQHDMQRAQGLAGLVGLLLVIFMVWQWDELFQPLLNAVGLVDFADRVGMVSELPIITVLNVIGVLFVLSLFIGLMTMAFAFIGIVFSIFGATKLGRIFFENAMLVVLAPILLPVFVLTFISRSLKGELKSNPTAGVMPKETTIEKFYKETPERRAEWKQVKELPGAARLFRLYQSQMKQQDSNTRVEEFTTAEQTELFLNRAVASIENDLDWLIAYDAYEDQHYILLPNPLPKFVSHCFAEKDLSSDGSVYGFEMAYIQNGMGNAREAAKFTAPALPVDFVWDGFAIQMNVTHSRGIKPYVVSDATNVYRIQSVVTQKVYRELSGLSYVQRAILDAHLALYIIPIAYLEKQTPIGEYHPYGLLERAKDVPNAEVFSMVYGADIKEKVQDFAERGETWAINYLKLIH